MTHSSLTQYIPLWYKPENIGKYNDIARPINLDIQLLPRISIQASTPEEYGEYELELLSKAGAYGLKIPYAKKDLEDFAELEYLVDQYEALDEDGLELAERARIWHMPIKEYHLEDINKLRHEIENYEKMLDEASTLWIGWETSTYDPQGLMEAIAEATGDYEDDHRCYVFTVNNVYRAERGV